MQNFQNKKMILNEGYMVLPQNKKDLSLEDLWWYNFSILKKNIKRINAKVIGSYGEAVNLGAWLDLQCLRYKENHLDVKKIKALKSLNLLTYEENNSSNYLIANAWLYMYEINDTLSALPLYKEALTSYEIWFYNYLLLEKYQEEYGHINLSPRDVVVGYYGDAVYLGQWLNKQKKMKKQGKLSSKKIELLEKLSINWLKFNKFQLLIPENKWIEAININKVETILPSDKTKLSVLDIWWYNYSLIKKYFKNDSFLYFPDTKKVIGYYGETVNLGIWLRDQRKRYNKKTLNENQLKVLNDVGMVWCLNPEDYNKVLEKKWLSKIIAGSVKTILPLNKNELSQQENWWYNLALLRDLYLKDCNLTMQFNQKVKGYYGEDVNLDSWYRNQRLHYQKNTLSQIKLAALTAAVSPTWFNSVRILNDKNAAIKLKMQQAAEKWTEALDGDVTSILPSSKDELNFYEIWWYNFFLTKTYIQEHQQVIINNKKVIVGYYGEVFNMGAWFLQQKRNVLCSKLNSLQSAAIKTIDLTNVILDSNIIPYEKWLSAIKSHTVIDILPSSKKDICFDDAWWYNYSIAYNYYEKKQNLYLKETEKIIGYYGETVDLNSWLTKQTKAAQNGSLSKNKIAALDKIGIIWKTDIVEFNKEKKKLAAKKWYQAILENTFKTLLPDDKQKLDHYEIWWYNFAIFKEYCKKNKTSKIKYAKMVAGYYGEDVFLGSWLGSQKRQYKLDNLIPEQVKALEDLGFSFSNNTPIKNTWDIYYKEAAKYYQKYGNLVVANNYIVILEDKRTIRLGYWLKKQRDQYRNGQLTSEQIKLLNDIDMVWHIRLSDWSEKYNALREYYQKYNNITIQSKTIVEISNGKFDLYSWLNDQKKDYWQGKLSEEQIKLLNNLNVDWTNLSKEWLQMYESAKKYYNEHGNLRVLPSKDSIGNGEFTKLHAWIRQQQNCYENNKLSNVEIDLLNQIGMIWNNKNNRNSIIDLVRFYGIDASKVSHIIKNYSYLELNAKICFCIDNGLSIVVNGNLNPIFIMCSKEILATYHVSLEDLILKYQDKMSLVRR